MYASITYNCDWSFAYIKVATAMTDAAINTNDNNQANRAFTWYLIHFALYMRISTISNDNVKKIDNKII